MSRFLPDIAGLFALIVFLVFALLISDQFLADGDPFWHIKAGSVILEQGRLLTQDIFSHTAYGTPWTAHEWLTEIIMAGLHRLAGLEGVILFFILLTAMTFWLLFKVAEQLSDEKTALFFTSFALFLSATHLTARPHLFTWFFLVLTLSLLIERDRKVYWLPPLIAVWVNLHGGFVLGLLLPFVFVLGHCLEQRFENNASFFQALSQQRHLIAALFLCLLAVGCNPFGYRLLLFPFHVTSEVFSANINEWKAPNFQDLWYARYALILLVFALTFRSIKISWTGRLLLLFFLNASLTHARNFSLFFIVSAPFLARALHTVVKDKISSPRRSDSQTLALSPVSGPLLIIGLSLFMMGVGTIHQGFLTFLSPQKVFGVETSSLEKLTHYLAENRPEGNLFNDYVLGGYLLYAMAPPPKVFIDGRADMYGEEIFRDYKTISLSARQRQELLEKYQIDWIVFERDTDLVYCLEQSGDWEAKFTQGPYAVLTRRGTSQKE